MSLSSLYFFVVTIEKENMVVLSKKVTICEKVNVENEIHVLPHYIYKTSERGISQCMQNYSMLCDNDKLSTILNVSPVCTDEPTNKQAISEIVRFIRNIYHL